MRRFKKIIKWFILSIISVLIIAVIILGITGVPKPSTISKEDVPRIKWSLAVDMYKLINKSVKNTRFNSWTNNDNGILIWSNTGGMRSKLHRISEPDSKPVLIDKLPDNARDITVNPAPDKHYMIFSMDEGGNEQYQLYRYDISEENYTRITDGRSRHLSGCFNKEGTFFTYSSNKRNGVDFDIYTIDPENPSSEIMICKGKGSWSAGQWSHNSDQIILRYDVSANESSICLFNLNTLERRDLFPEKSGTVYYGDAVWGVNDNVIYYISDYNSEFKQLHMLNLITGMDTVLTADINWDVEDLEISQDARWLALRVNEDGLVKLYIINCGTNDIQLVPSVPSGTVGYMKFHPLKNILAFNHTSTFSLTNVFVLNLNTLQLTEWTNKPGADESLPLPQTVHYPTFDMADGKQREISAYILRSPARFEEPGPALIDIHGGPESQASPVMNHIHEIARNKGVNIIIPNVRGSSGYGKGFLKLDNGYLRENSVKDIGALLDWIESQPDFNSEHIAVFGGSYGGYMVLATSVNYSDRLRCGIDLFGITNFTTFLENTSDYRRDLRRAEYGDERIPEMRQYLDSISPLNNSNKINIPLLVYQGKNDPRVPLSESMQIVESIRENGKIVWYLEASNEGHGLTQPLNYIFVGAAALTFLEEYLLN